jgi:copper chaperone CopZ
MAIVSDTIKVSGIRCERCVGRLGGALRRLEGLESARATLTGEVSLTWDDQQLERSDIVAALARAGFHTSNQSLETNRE